MGLARVENQRQGVTADQVRAWCANPDTEVVVKPVIDLNDHHRVEGYEIPDRLREQTQLRTGTCVFPWCTRPARTADCDHVIPYEQGGSTCSCNLAALCRRHHRLKTHSGWSYTVLEPGSFLWSSPYGYQFLRNHEGTLDVTPTRRPRGPTDSPCLARPTRPVATPPRNPAEPNPAGPPASPHPRGAPLHLGGLPNELESVTTNPKQPRTGTTTGASDL